MFGLTRRTLTALVVGTLLLFAVAGAASAAVFVGGNGPDELVGTPRNDRLFGGNGSDLLRARGGNDRLNGGSGNDTCNGGKGRDIYIGCEVRNDPSQQSQNRPD